MSNYNQTLGMGGFEQGPGTIGHLDFSLPSILAEIYEEDPAIARGFIAEATAFPFESPEPDAGLTYEKTQTSLWLASLAAQNLLTPSQLAEAQRREDFLLYEAAVKANLDRLSR